MNKTKIEWTDYTWNPVTGCLHNCSYCYMQRMVKRGIYDMKPAFHEKRLRSPIDVKEPSKIFVSSTGDLFGNWVPDAWIELVLDIVRKCPQHTFQFLTKNPKRYREFVFPQNCWLGTTIDGEKKTINNGHDLVNVLTNNGTHQTKNLTFISFEPLLCDVWNKLQNIEIMLDHIDWIIIGADSNHGAKKPEQKWIEKLIEYADNNGIEVWIKNNFNCIHHIKNFPRVRESEPKEEKGNWCGKM